MKFLTRAQALARMRRGDLPTQGGGYSSALYFDDGMRTSGPIGHRLFRDGLIERPQHTSVTSRYTLAATSFNVGDRVTFNGGFKGTVIEIYSPGMIVVRGERGAVCIPNEDAVKETR